MIETMSPAKIAEIVGGQLYDLHADRSGWSEQLVTGVSIDTRTLRAGDLFIAIKGPHFDGHDYLEAAHVAGAVAALTEHYVASAPLVQIVVTSTEQALGQLGAANRQRFTGC